MIVSLREWIIKICTVVFFITAVEMILPNNSLKKYSKFVLGLILITVLINPIIKVFDKNFSIDVYTNKAASFFNEEGYKNNFDQYKEKSKTSTLDVFKANLKSLCESKLKERFPQDNYKVDVDVVYDETAEKMVIKTVDIEVKSGNVERIKKVDISIKNNPTNSDKPISNEHSNSIKEYLSKEINIPMESIYVYES